MSEVEVLAGQVPHVGGPAWESVRDALSSDTSEQGLGVHQFIFDSPMLSPTNGLAEALREYALQSFTPSRGIVEAG